MLTPFDLKHVDSSVYKYVVSFAMIVKSHGNYPFDKKFA